MKPVLTNFIYGVVAMIALFASATLVQAQQSNIQINSSDSIVPWSNLDFNNDPQRFQFAIVTDRTGGHRPGVFMDAVNKLNLLQPEFVVSVGDLIEGYTTDLNELNRQWDEFDGFVDQLQMPFFYVPGNHDITNQVMEDLWKERLGATHYSFVYQNVLMLCLNSEDQRRGAGKGTISDAQYDWIKTTLEKHPDVRWTMVFMHQPLWDQKAETLRWADVEKLLANRKHTVYVGHRHSYVQYERNDSKYYILATTGGGTNARGSQFGEFDHVVWITMTDEGPIMANLQLEGIWNADLVTENTKQYINKVGRKTVVEIMPNFEEGDQFERTSMQLKLTNDEDVPMEVVFEPAFNFDVMAALDTPAITVAPNSVRFVNLDLQARRPMPIERVRPVNVEATVRFAFSDSTALGIPQAFNIQPLQKRTFQKTTTAFELDGDLKDWGELAYKKTWADDAADVSLQYDIRYDDEFVYVAAHVMDEEINTDEGSSYFSQDGIAVIMSVDPLSKSIVSRGRSWFKNEVSMYLPPTATGELKKFGHSKGTPKDVQRVCKVVEGGYIMEMALPISYIQEKQGENWQHIRMNILITDYDDQMASKTLNWLFPNWRSKENVIGSGVFSKE